ncbi:MAG: sensor domain-containing diguanylate cyclase [Solirubrobacteraceae bacterium]
MAHSNEQRDQVKPTAGSERENGSRPPDEPGIPLADLAAGVDPRDHEITHDIRQRTTNQREYTAGARLDAASDRDAGAHARDLAARRRDQAADACDLAMAQSDTADQQAAGRSDFGMQIIARAIEHRGRAAKQRAQAAEHRRRAAGQRARAAEHRVLAAADRRNAAEDREEAAEERLRAAADRETSAAGLAIAATDPLTGARTRATGLEDLEHELDRCRRTSNGLVVVYVDVVRLKDLNDNIGHDTGDELLRGAVKVFKAHLRAYDLIIRLGGDEFLCAMSNISESDVRKRFSVITGELAAKPGARRIRTGFAALRTDETVAEVIARADGELTDSRHTNDPEEAPQMTASPTNA